MSRTGFAALAAALLLACGCAASVPTLPPEAAGAGGAVWIDLVLKNPLDQAATPPTRVWFVRIGGLNGSACLPRPATYPADPAPDPTCPRDAEGNPRWEPVFLEADRIAGSRALLLDPPPARYVAVAAAFPRRKEGTVTLYFSRTLIAHTEMPLPAGATGYMGSYRLHFGDWPFLDPAQTFVRGHIEAEAGGTRAGAPSPAAGLLGGLVRGSTPTGLHRPARWEQLRSPAPRQKDTGKLW
jgi:hypothetical protein